MTDNKTSNENEIIECTFPKGTKERILDTEEELNDFINDAVFTKLRIYGSEFNDTQERFAVWHGIVSKGIHELTEEECMRFFPILKESILMILEKWEAERQRNENEKRLSASLAKISGEIK